MERYSTRFEDLPNELILEICKYFNGREIYQSFYSINKRFRKLIQSSENYLSLTVSLFDFNEFNHYNEYFTYIKTLIINRGFTVDLKNFKTLRRLMLRNPKEQIFEQLNHHSLPYLEYLCIRHKFLTSTIEYQIVHLHQKIFSNHFPNLRSCDLSEIKVEMPMQVWSSSLSLKVLKVGSINIIVYRAILSECLNLHIFQFKTLPCDYFVSNNNFHLNLKRLIIINDDQSFPWNDRLILDYLICVPNLQKLIIHRNNFFKKLIDYANYDWLMSIISRCLFLLRQFIFVLHVYDSKRLTRCYRENIFCSLKEHFLCLHKDRYRACIKFVEE